MKLTINYIKNHEFEESTFYFDNNLFSIAKSYDEIIKHMKDLQKTNIIVFLSIDIYFDIKHTIQKKVLRLKVVGVSEILTPNKYLKSIDYCLKISNIKHTIKCEGLDENVQYEANNFYYTLEGEYNKETEEVWHNRLDRDLIINIPKN